jgi:hypothetical protein
MDKSSTTNDIRIPRFRLAVSGYGVVGVSSCPWLRGGVAGEAGSGSTAGKGWMGGGGGLGARQLGAALVASVVNGAKRFSG